VLSQSNEGCGWAGPLPEFKEKGVCQACQKLCSAGEVLRCQMKGKPIPKPTTQRVVKPVITHALGMPRRFSSGLGDCLKQKFDAYKVKQKPGCSCKDIQKTLNSMTAEQIEKDISLYVDNIFENVQNLSGLVGTAIKVFSWVSPDSAKTRIRELLLECLESAKAPESPTEPPDSKDDSEPVQPVGSP